MMTDNKQLINSLRKRFISDNKLPIDVFHDDDVFFYFLTLYEKDFKSKTSWDSLVDTIDKKFNGNPQLFLDEYYKVKDKMITEIADNQYFKEFNNSSNDLSKYNLPDDAKKYPSKNIYNCENDNKIFLSIDLNKANYSALMYHNPKILGCDIRIPYEEWVNKYTDLEYIKQSKYTRQVVFGKLNPSRQIKVEKYMIWQVFLSLKEDFESNNINFNVASFSTDEIVFSIENNENIFETIWTIVEKTISVSECIIPIKATLFKLNVKRFKTFNDGILNVFEKEFIKGKSGKELKGVPSYFYAQVFKILNGVSINEYDKMFWCNDQPAIFLNNLELI